MNRPRGKHNNYNNNKQDKQKQQKYITTNKQTAKSKQIKT